MRLARKALSSQISLNAAGCCMVCVLYYTYQYLRGKLQLHAGSHDARNST